VLTAVFFAPIAYMLVGSFKPSEEVLDGMAGFLPTNLSLDNYIGVITRFNSPATGYFANFYFTSALVSFVIVVDQSETVKKRLVHTGRGLTASSLRSRRR
jgi:multiple sugar transport system permease protein